MADYTSTFSQTDGVDTIDAADFSTEFDAIQVAVASKTDETSGTLTTPVLNGSAVNATGTEVNTVCDGDTSATATTIADADRVPLNDNGTMVQVAVTDLLTYINSNKISLASATATTSGTDVLISGVPSWAKRVVITFNAVSTNGTDTLELTLGDSGGLEVTGYFSMYNGTTVGVATATDAFVLCTPDNATDVFSGTVTLTMHESSSNTWCLESIITEQLTEIFTGVGRKALSSTLTQINLGTSGGVNTFDAGQIAVLYEG